MKNKMFLFLICGIILFNVCGCSNNSKKDIIDNNNINEIVESNQQNNEKINEHNDEKDNEDKIKQIEKEEINITISNLFEYFEIKKENIIPELNAFGERGTEVDFYYNLSLYLKSTYEQKLISINVSVEFASETYLRSYNYDRKTGIGTVTDEYKRLYNNTDKFLCNMKDQNNCYITSCHYADSETINGKLIYYAYITDKLEPIRVAGSIIINK